MHTQNNCGPVHAAMVSQLNGLTVVFQRCVTPRVETTVSACRPMSACVLPATLDLSAHVSMTSLLTRDVVLLFPMPYNSVVQISRYNPINNL